MARDEDHHPTLPQLLKQLASDGARVVDVELALSRAELATIIRGRIMAMAIGVASVAVLVVALTMLAQAAAIALEPYVVGSAVAFLCVAVVLAGVAATLAFAAHRMFKKKHEPVGLICKWLAGSGRPQ